MKMSFVHTIQNITMADIIVKKNIMLTHMNLMILSAESANLTRGKVKDVVQLGLISYGRTFAVLSWSVCPTTTIETLACVGRLADFVKMSLTALLKNIVTCLMVVVIVIPDFSRLMDVIPVSKKYAKKAWNVG